MARFSEAQLIAVGAWDAPLESLPTGASEQWRVPVREDGPRGPI
jgi:hypothetical protein